jgi:diketogulonate reductase-like aldo/keto reductase
MRTPTSEFRNVRGLQVPSLFYGTAWKQSLTKALTSTAIRSGFRAIDTANQAKHYVEAAVGDAVEDALRTGLARQGELFVQTKFTRVSGHNQEVPYDPQATSAEQVAQSIASSLRHLRAERIDSYLLHSPSAATSLTPDDWAIWRAMERAVDAGQVSLLGVCNISLPQLETLLDGAAVRPAFVQNRCVARTGWDAYVRALCQDHDVAYQAFSLVRSNQTELASAAVLAIATHYSKTVSQVVLRFATQMGIIPVIGTGDGRHMLEALEIFDFQLSASELEEVFAIGL